jgi:hypothetical protein
MDIKQDIAGKCDKEWFAGFKIWWDTGNTTL